jgi:hypothetical protein
MRKILLLGLALLLSMVTAAQNKPVPKEQKGYLGFTAGVGLPVGAFASTNTSDGGMAVTGFQATIHGGYSIVKHFGVGGNIFYSTYGLNTELFSGTGAKLDHWQYYGMTVGPYVSVIKSPKTELNIKLFMGMATANSPVLTLENQSTNDTWATAFSMQTGADLKYQFSPATFLFLNADYTAMRPTFKDAALGEYRQDIYALHFGAGIGFRF